MHRAVLRYISFDERVFQNGPVLLDDGAYSHVMIPDLEEYLPVIDIDEHGEYTLCVSASVTAEGINLLFSIYSSDHRKVKTIKTPLGFGNFKTPFYASEDELDDYITGLYVCLVEKALNIWFSEADSCFFETVGIYTRAAIEDTYKYTVQRCAAPLANAEFSPEIITIH